MSRSALVLKHTSRAARIAHSDRYSLIRTFFTRPTSHSSSSLLASWPSSRSAPVSLPAFPLHRNFHSLWSLRGNRFSTHITPQNSERQEHRHKATLNAPPTNDSLRSDQSPNNLQDNNYPRFFRRLAQSLPHVSRPSRDDFLHAANGIGQRMRVRVRWFFIRNFHKFNADDISAFVTWFLVGQGLWILIGTSVLTEHAFPLNC